MGIIGYGVFTSTDISKGTFVLEYCGNLLSATEANELLNQTFTYYFSIKRLQYWYDCNFCFYTLKFHIIPIDSDSVLPFNTFCETQHCC